MKTSSMRMDYQLPPQQTLPLGGGHTTVQTASQHLQILQSVHQQQQQQQQQQQHQQQILGNMQPPPPLPPLSSLPLQVVHNLPHLMNNGNNSASIVQSLNLRNSNSNNNAAASLNGGNNSNANNNTANSNNGNNGTNGGNANNGGNSGGNSNSTQHNSNNNHNNGNHGTNHPVLPPPSQILHHHLHQMSNNNHPPNHNTGSGGGGGGSAGGGGGTGGGSVGNHPSNNGPGTGTAEDSNRWAQFQVQQLWRHHAYLNGKSSNSKDICGDDKFKEEGDPWNVEAQAAFLGPNLWDKTLPYDADLKVTQYADLDEFLSENNIPDGLPGTHLGHGAGLGHRSDSLGHSTGLSLGLGHVTTKRERSPSPSDCVSPDTINPPSPAESTFSFASSGRDFDPRTRAFSDEELKPQPMIKKSRKQFVPDELKDDKYWARRRKNNIAAKRSRDARRQKENQIAMRARYLEKENSTLHQEVEQLKQENMELRARLSKYQEV